MIPKFFENDEFYINEKVQFMRFGNIYKIFDNQGTEIGSVQENVPGIQKILRLLLNKKMLPFELNILDAEGNVLITIKRGMTLWMSNIQIQDHEGNKIGTLKQKFKFLKPTFNIANLDNEEIGSITGDWKAWNFTIKDKDENEIGAINKKWGGAVKELFTTADKYRVSINKEYSENMNKVNILSAAIAIDMILKES